ncbi:MAG: SPOR domain-containing protein [Muribaculaceae bacterium]|nr:SPOR domain-containing protein [Muribaculaceae bacterium]
MKRIAILTLAIACLGLRWASAQAPDSIAEHDNIVETINAANGPVFIVQPQELDAVTAHSSVDTRSSRNMGYRLQIYSDNNVRTSKATAERIRSTVAESVSSMPGVRVHVVFDSPWWRVYVGDFRSYSAADEAMHRIKRLLPAQARDMRIMRCKLNTTH